jgi:hypothetical protein
MTTRRPLGTGPQRSQSEPAESSPGEQPRRSLGERWLGRTVAEQAAAPSGPTWEERQQQLQRIDDVLELITAGEEGPVVMLGEDYRLPTDLPRRKGLQMQVVMAEDYDWSADRPRRELGRGPEVPSAD